MAAPLVTSEPCWKIVVASSLTQQRSTPSTNGSPTAYQHQHLRACMLPVNQCGLWRGRVIVNRIKGLIDQCAEDRYQWNERLGPSSQEKENARGREARSRSRARSLVFRSRREKATRRSKPNRSTSQVPTQACHTTGSLPHHHVAFDPTNSSTSRYPPQTGQIHGGRRDDDNGARAGG